MPRRGRHGPPAPRTGQRDETGAELAEYAVAVALLVAIGLIVYNTLGGAINDANSVTGESIQDPQITF
jgi:Flp pilus assembly pilin Flp